MSARPGLSDIFLGTLVLSLMAVGGANAIVPELHRQTVELRHWLSGPEFAALFAIASAAPGPNVLIVTLIGWQLAGIPGALVATLGICAPSSLLAWTVGHIWERLKGSPWRAIIQRGLAPVTIGLVLGSGWLLTGAAAKSWHGVALAAVAALVYWRAKFNPLWVLGAGALIGLVRWL
ncbi:MAG: chromate transporter [Betaproteobacteria bacterium]|nr:chromate transporter [Betaproteobacteria bacterium]